MKQEGEEGNVQFHFSWQEVGTRLAGELDQEQSENRPQRKRAVVDKHSLIDPYRADVRFHDQLGVKWLFEAIKRRRYQSWLIRRDFSGEQRHVGHL